MHQFADGTPCRAAALKRSTRCRHHQLDFRLPKRTIFASLATEHRNKKFIASKAPELIRQPFAESSAQLRRWRELGILSPKRERGLRYALQINASAKRQVQQLRDNKSFASGANSI